MANTFSQRAAGALQNDPLRSSFTRSTSLLKRWREAGAAETTDFAVLQAAAAALRLRTIGQLPALLQQFEAAVLANGGEVIWAADAEEARRAVVALAEARRAKTIVRGRSAVAEEIGIDAALEAVGLHCTCTELGDAILQLSGDGPSHPVYPALHWRKEEVAALFTKHLDMPETVDIQSMAGMARFQLRRQLIRADMSVDGVELAVAENGILALASDSGADRLGLACARLHVALMGVEQVVATLDELWFLLQLKARSASGAALAASVTLLDRPAQGDDPDGPAELVVVIVDNGRSDLIRWGYGDALACIRCGACHNSCPVYREIGGQAYGGHLAGPIGSVLLPLSPAPETQPAPGGRRLVRSVSGRRARSPATLQPAEHLSAVLRGTAFAELPHASPLCGACAEVCPVGIDIPKLLVALRTDLVRAGRMSTRDRMQRRLFAWAMASPENYRRWKGWLARRARVGGSRRFEPAARSFRERWAAKGGSR